jgi:hypothetical protein
MFMFTSTASKDNLFPEGVDGLQYMKPARPEIISVQAVLAGKPTVFISDGVGIPSK